MTPKCTTAARPPPNRCVSGLLDPSMTYLVAVPSSHLGGNGAATPSRKGSNPFARTINGGYKSLCPPSYLDLITFSYLL